MRLILSLLILAMALGAQSANFRWINPLPTDAHPALQHGTYQSKVNDAEVGYVIYLPPGYEDAANSSRRYPVVYWLHGGRPGSEIKNTYLAPQFEAAMESKKVPPMIYVLVNGGCLSHYDHQGCLGETTFITELIPHVDNTYRTIARREGRGLEGFSQGGRGTARIMFKHPHLFASAAPMGGGHQYEKTISENNGVESEAVVISPPGNNTWDLARDYAQKRMKKYPLPILVVVGTDDKNYQPNLDWMEHLAALGIKTTRIILPDTPHSGREAYRQRGEEIMQFHVGNFRKALGKDW